MLIKKLNIHLSFSVLMILIMLLWYGCANLPAPTQSKHLSEKGILGSCSDFFAYQDQKILTARVIDPGAYRINDYPYLRINRFLASFGKEVENEKAFSDWIDRLQKLDQQARRYEVANLSAEQSQKTIQKIDSCGELLKREDFKSLAERQQLSQTITVPDEYIDARRILGIYPLTGWFVSRGISKWQKEARQSFSLAPPIDWQKATRYLPPQNEALPSSERITTLVQRDALGIPQYTPGILKALFAVHAPVWEVETSSEADKIGAPVWKADKKLQINTKISRTYLLHNFTRFNQKILTQLNYIIWFPARPKANKFDIYGGRLDGINYRVTLDVDGSPLLYETIHNCGCYYKAYPTSRLNPLMNMDHAEPPLIFKAPLIDPEKEVMVVSIESRTHYVQHLYPYSKETQADKFYTYADYNELRSLPLPSSGRKSMFRSDGIVPESQRLERFFLWPTGVFSPGAMRQWGRHAITLVGKRHFDDPFYMEEMFEATVPNKTKLSTPQSAPKEEIEELPLK